MSTFAEHVPLADDVEVEEARVARWRYDGFRALGFEPDDAFLLTISRVDLQAARTLIEEGCSIPLALRILLWVAGRSLRPRKAPKRGLSFVWLPRRGYDRREMSATREGGCSCGEVRYRLTSDPLFVHCCHCLACQRQTGSAFVVNVLIEADRVELRRACLSHRLRRRASLAGREPRAPACAAREGLTGRLHAWPSCARKVS